MIQTTFLPLLIGAFFALPYIIYATIQTIRGRRQTNGLGTALGYVALLVPVAALVVSVLGSTSSLLMNAAIIGNAVVVLLISAVIFILDMRHTPRDLSHSYGVLGVGIAVMLIGANVAMSTLLPNAAAFAVNLNTNQSQINSQSINGQSANNALSAASTYVTLQPATSILVPTATLTPTVAFTATAAPTLILSPTETAAPSRTLFRYSSPTPIPTQAGATCEVVVQSNLNLRAEPNAGSERYATIPYATRLNANESSEDSAWLAVEYEGQSGWVSSEYVRPVLGCENLLAQ